MSYRLHDDEPVGKGLRRIVRKELRSAIDRLTSDHSDEGLHEARKSIKKARAVLQLVGDEVRAGRAMKQLREASHLLSPLRDADVLIETARGLCSRRTGASARACHAIGSELTSEKATLQRHARRTRVRAHAARVLDRVRRAARHWQWSDAGFSTLREAIRRTYKRARRRMQQARERNDGDAFHEWRKGVKTLWYALRLLEDRVEQLRRPLADLHRLETELGDDHNLVVLRTKLENTSTSRDGEGRARVRDLSERRQREKRRVALSLGVRLFAHPPKAFARRLRQMWETDGMERRARAVA